MSGAGEGPDAAPDPELERLRAALYAPDAPPGAAARYRTALARSAPAAEAVDEEAPDEPPAVATAERRSRSRPRLRSALAAGALLLAAGIGVALLAPRPAAEDQPLRVGPAIWSGHATTAAGSPVLDGRGGPVLVRLRCRGEGRILLAVDGRIRSLTCAAGRSIEDDQYFDGSHGQFLLSLSLVGHPAWTASVHRVRLTG